MKRSEKIVVYGAGGLGREVAWLIRRINQAGGNWDFLGYVVTNPEGLGPHDSADEVLGDESWLWAHEDVSVALGIGTPKYRVEIGRRLQERLAPERLPALVDPSAVFDPGSCTFGPGSIVTAGCIFTVNVKLDPFAFVNLDCTIGHESCIGYGCVLNPSVNISGGVNLEEGVLVGTGAQVLQYLGAGPGAVIGSGSVVTKNVEAGVTVVGIPARPFGR